MWLGRLRIVFIWKFPNSNDIYIIPFKFVRSNVCGCKVIVLFNVAFIISTKRCYQEAKRIAEKKKNDLP